MYHCVKSLQQMLNVFYLFISMTVKMVQAHYEKLLTVLSTGLKNIYLVIYIYKQNPVRHPWWIYVRL